MSVEQFDDAAREEFARSMAKHLAGAGGLADGVQVLVRAVRAGSVVVDYDIVPPAGLSAEDCAARRW